MNRWEIKAADGWHAPRKISNCFQDREEELSFFRDLQKREKDQVASLLQPIFSEEFEANGDRGLYRMESAGRKGPGLEFLAETGKNDYNWLKTPPATPLFPSLEMETNGTQELIIQREIPIIQPLSRFAGKPGGAVTSTNRSTSPNSKPLFPQLHKKNMKTAPIINPKINQSTSNGLTERSKPSGFTPVTKSITHKQSLQNVLASNLTKSAAITESNSITKPKISRGVSPSIRPKIQGFSDDTPPNLRTTNRPASANRGRPSNQNFSLPQKQEINARIRRQSCSPSVARGRKSDAGSATVATQTSKVKQAEYRPQVLGSRMVDKFMNARISNAEDRQAKMKLNNSMNESSRSSMAEERQGKIILNGASLNESSGFGRLMSKSSMNTGRNHMDFQRDWSNIRVHGMVPGRKH